MSYSILINVPVAIDTVGTNKLQYINRSYLCIPVKLINLRYNKY
jgi:hypothetical protein